MCYSQAPGDRSASQLVVADESSARPLHPREQTSAVVFELVGRGPKAEIITVVGQPGVGSLMDGYHGGHGDENDSHERP